MFSRALLEKSLAHSTCVVANPFDESLSFSCYNLLLVRKVVCKIRRNWTKFKFIQRCILQPPDCWQNNCQKVCRNYFLTSNFYFNGQLIRLTNRFKMFRFFLAPTTVRAPFQALPHCTNCVVVSSARSVIFSFSVNTLC